MAIENSKTALDDDDLMDFHELRARGIPRSTAYKLIEAGKLRAVKVGRSTRIRGSDYRRYVESLPSIAPKHAA